MYVVIIIILVVERLQRSPYDVAVSSKPQSPRVEQISPTKTRISWDVPQTASAIHNYELKIDKSLTRQFSISPPNTSYHLEGLIRNTEYSISVLAKNKYGEGSCSDSKKYKTHRYRKLNDVVNSLKVHFCCFLMPPPPVFVVFCCCCWGRVALR